MSAYTVPNRRAVRLAAYITAGVVGWVAAMSWAIPAAAETTSEPPDVVMLDELEDLYEPVPFEHRLHAEMAEIWGGCETCHHRTPNGHTKSGHPATNGEAAHTQDEAAEVPACKSCHPVGEDNTDIRMPSLNAAYHRQCLDCHRDWDHEKSCVVCHEPKEGAATPGVMPTPDVILGRMHPPTEPPTVKVYETRYTPAAGGLVTFRHEEHVKNFGFKCVECHRRDTCASCHSEDGADGRRKPLVPAESWRLSHEPCLSCHDHQTCNHCHHKSEGDSQPTFEHRMTGQLLDQDHENLLCRSCHGEVKFTAIPTCGDTDCHESPELASFPDDRPGERIASVLPTIRRQTMATVYGVAPRNGHAELTKATDTIVNETAPPPTVLPRTRMTTVERPTTITQSCVTDECHAAIKSYDVVHGPVAIDACGVCHESIDEGEHLFAIVRDRQELCTYCHEFDVDAMPVVHTPTKEGECLGCHNPHGGHDRSITREASIELLCNRCHESMTAQNAFLHSPVGDGYCVSCHSPHASKYPMLLDAIGPDLCLTCHDEFGQQLDQAKFVHEALDEQCTRCHDAHGSAFPASLAAPGSVLCFDCHEETKVKMANADYTHSAATEDRECMTCHTPHGGNMASLMRDLPVRICVECHGEPIVTADDRVIGAVSEVMSEDLYKHGQIGDGECSGCHESHGGERAMFLTGDYPAGYYAKYSEDSFGLCFQCHESELATQREVTIAEDAPTKFRNGELNLHYLHVSSGIGRSCRICHNTHAGENARLVRTVVPYQKWEAPLELTVTESGGRCITGCHLPFSYDRDTPVPFAKQREAGEQMRRVRAGQPSTIETRWKGTDMLGAKVSVPHESRTTLMLFMRAEPGDDLAAVDALRKAIPAHDELQVVLVLKGELAIERTDAIRGVNDLSWHIVLDEQALITAARIKARPIVLVIRPDGREIARIGGAPQSLALKLQAYIDLARQDEMVGPTLQPLQPGVIGRHPGVEPDQYLRVARQFIADGAPQQAEQVLHEAIEMHPNEGDLYAELISLLIDTARSEDAIMLLDRLPGGVIDQQVSALLRARAYIELQRWEEARDLSSELLVSDPDLREAHHLMGLIHQHNSEWREAAESFLQALGPER